MFFYENGVGAGFSVYKNSIHMIYGGAFTLVRSPPPPLAMLLSL